MCKGTEYSFDSEKKANDGVRMHDTYSSESSIA